MKYNFFNSKYEPAEAFLGASFTSASFNGAACDV
jgi:hypothetical protein